MPSRRTLPLLVLTAAVACGSTSSGSPARSGGTGTVGWFISEAPIVILAASFLLSSLHKSHHTGVAVRGAAGDEMTPRARVRGLLNRLPLICELPHEGPGFDDLAERQLL